MIKKVLLIIILVGFALRLGFISTLQPHFYFDDEPIYESIVQNLSSGKGLIIGESQKAFRPPLFSLIVAPIYLLGGGLVTIRIFQALLSTLTIYLIYLLSREIFNERISIASAGISAIWPFFIFYTGFFLTETTYIFLTVISTLYFLKVLRQPSFKNVFLTGIFLGLAGLCRPIMLLYAPFGFLFLFFAIECSGRARSAVIARSKATKQSTRSRLLHFVRNDDGKEGKASFATTSIRSKIYPAFLVGLFCLLTVSPWVIRNYRIFHRFVPGTTMGGHVFYEGNNPYSTGGPCSYFPSESEKMGEIERDKFLFNQTFKIIRGNPKRFIWLLCNKFKRYWSFFPNAPGFQAPLYRLLSFLAIGLPMPFFLVGFFLSFKFWRKTIFLTGQIMFNTIFHIIFLASIRYRVPIEPFFIILGVFGLERIFHIKSQKFGR